MIEEGDSGIELDILRAALKHEGYSIDPLYLPFARAYQLFDTGKLDGVLNANQNSVKAGHLPAPVVTFQNYAISLKKKGFPKDINFGFFKDKTVIAFQKASQLIGGEYAEAVVGNLYYDEIAKQELQLKMLFVREVDFIVMDGSVFGYYWYQMTNADARNKEFFEQEVVFHPLFEPSDYPFLFREKEVRDHFNYGLQRIKQDGTYDEIFKKYSHLSNLYQAK